MMDSDTRTKWKLELVDQISLAGGSANDDHVRAASGAAWILDGATGLSQKRLLPGESDASWFVNEISDAIGEELRGGDDTKAILARTVGRVAGRYAEIASLDAEVEGPCASFAMVRVCDDQIELSSLGDCTILYTEGDAVRTFGSSPVAELDRAVVRRLQQLREEGITAYEDAWPYLVTTIHENRRKRNQPEGYWVLDMTSEPISHLQIMRTQATSSLRILLATDGFYRLVEFYQRYDNALLLGTAWSRGLAFLGAELRAIEQSDPECIRFPRIKRRDDASAMLVSLTSA